eukprot:COSAG01_NODE_1130_length_11575_cov_6.349773_10_plen_122_part_00
MCVYLFIAYSHSLHSLTARLQCVSYGPDLEHFFAGINLEFPDAPPDPCGASILPEPYKSTVQALCPLYEFIYEIYKSPNPTTDFGMPFVELKAYARIQYYIRPFSSIQYYIHHRFCHVFVA